MKNSENIDASKNRQGEGHSGLKRGSKARLHKAFALRGLLLLCLASALQFAAPAQARQAPAASPQAAPVRRSDEMVAVRDGVKLATSVYLPEGKGPWPAVLVRTPYNKELQAVGHAAWTKRGFALVVQDCRGKFKSEGKYDPFVEDPQDGYDSVEWVAKQPWSNARVGMYGASAMGITANLAALMRPPHLVANFVMVARSSIYNQSAFMGGVFRRELNEIWLKRQNALDALNETFKHNVYDGYYDSNEMSKQWDKVQIPVYNYGGWYDIFSEGNVQNFAGLQAGGGGLALGNQKLIMGPWGHGNMEEVKYPSNATVNPVDEALRWFDYWLNGKNNGIRDEAPVKYYVMGDVTDPKAPGNEWRTATAWPVPSRPTSYFMLPGGKLGEMLSGEQESASSYKYDPKNPVPTIGGANLNIKRGPMDQRAVGERKDVLKFLTPVLESPVEVTGRVTVELWAESDAPDTDWMAKLVDVYPDGTERLVLDSAFRARFREGFDREVFMKKGEVYKFKIDLWNTSLIFNKGHRIAVHITSSNDPRFDPNPNTGRPLRADSETRVATNTIHHDRAHPSRLILPVVPLSVETTSSR
ncbi:MAG TPA: CocE/NonD family hydrolase [Blastocatellia bacterium]|nr:CocE/NonD family hydrolase [Blastocatellia bacterium]